MYEYRQFYIDGAWVDPLEAREEIFGRALCVIPLASVTGCSK